MFRREQLSPETLLAIGAQGTLRTDAQSAPGRLWALLQQGDAKGLPLPAIERRLLQDAVAEADGNLSAAARQLGITRAQLAYRLQRAEAPPRRKRRVGA